MTETQKPVRAGRMLGPFALVFIATLLLIALSIIVSVIISFDASDVADQTTRHTQLQLAQYYLLDLEVIAREAVYYTDPADQQSIIADYEHDVAEIDAALAELAGVSYTDYELEEMDTIREYQQTLATNVEETLAAAAAGEDPIALLENTSDDELAINADMDVIIFDAQADLNVARKDLEESRAIALWVTITVLALFPLLAVWAYFISSRFTEPMLQIDNAIMAAGSKTYRDTLLVSALRRRDGIGQLARSVDSMAKALGTQNAVLEQEIATARQQLNDVRRRRLSQN
jgi:nitrate/nitrite-specific signal transduction histidine kinase